MTPVEAVRKVAQKIGWKLEDVDLDLDPARAQPRCVDVDPARAPPRCLDLGRAHAQDTKRAGEPEKPVIIFEDPRHGTSEQTVVS